MNMNTPNPTGFRDVALTIVGWIALLLYILACSSWSPDGSKLLFSYYNPETDQAGVAIHDRDTGKTRSVLLVPDPDTDTTVVPVQWEKNGRRAIVSLHELLLLPLGSSEPALSIELADLDFEWTYPYPEVEGNLYFGGDDLVRISLRTGKVTSRARDEDDDLMLFDGGGQVFYARKVFAPAQGDESPPLRGHEIGNLDLGELTLAPLFVLGVADLETREMEDLSWLLSFEPGGDRVAVTGMGEGGARILICTRSGIQQVLVPELSAEKYVLGNLQWSSDGETLYAAAFLPGNEEKETLYSLAEIPIGGGPGRLVSITEIHDRVSHMDEVAEFHIALSPDGSTIATTTAYLGSESIEAENRALYLVDVRDPKRPVTKIGLPAPPTDREAAKGE